MPTIFKQQELDGITGENESDGSTDDDIGEILASMSRADALHLFPTAIEGEQGSSTPAPPSQSVFPVVDSKPNQDITAGSHANGASRCGLSPSTYTFLIISLVVLCIEVAIRFVF